MIFQFLDILNNFIMFVPNLTDKALKHVLHGDKTGRAAVFIHDDGHMGLCFLELAQELGEYAARGFVYAELELTFSEAVFDTAATIDGYTQADVNITNYSIKAR